MAKCVTQTPQAGSLWARSCYRWEEPQLQLASPTASFYFSSQKGICGGQTAGFSSGSALANAGEATQLL